MKVYTAILASVLLVLSLACRRGPVGELPQGWRIGGTALKDYDVVVHNHEGENVISIENHHFVLVHGFGSVGRVEPASPYRGQRIQFKMHLQADHVTDRAALWMRINQKTRILAFDNMPGRSLRGTTTWRAYQIVLDVPALADSIAYGFLLRGRGTVSAKLPQLTIVGSEVPSTDISSTLRGPSKSCNCTRGAR